MNIFSRLFGWMLGGRRSHEPDHPDLNPLDLDQLKRELKVEQQAERLGKAGLPASDATTLSGPEMAIIQRLETTRRNYQGWAHFHLKVLHNRMSGYDITELCNRTHQEAAEFERLANEVLSDTEPHLRHLQKVAAQKEAELAEFRDKNRLTRRAHESTVLKKWILVLAALLIVGVEGVLNASFFAQGVDGGLIEGFGIAFIMALANVFVALMLGALGVRNKNHVKPLRKCLGYLSLGLALCMMLLIGLVIAHFRDSLTTAGDVGMEVVAAMALQSLLITPFGLHDIFSLMLLLLSVVFALMALLEGYHWSDPYPGYEKLQKVAEAARLQYQNEITELRDELSDLKDAALIRVEQALEKSRVDVLSFKKQVDDKKSSRASLKHARKKAELMLTTLISCFRTENQIYRQASGVPVPAYFNTPPVIKSLEWPSFDTSEDELALTKQQVLLSNLLDSVEGIRAQIQASYNSKFDQQQRIDDQFSGVAN